MKIILIQDVKNLGKKNSVLEVSDGYFKNYLSKKKLAVIYSAASAKHLNEDLKVLADDELKKRNEAKALKSKIEKISLTFSLKANKGNTFWSISQKQIIQALKEKGIEINKFMFDANFQPLKIGKIKIILILYKDIKAELSILVKEEK